MPNFRDLLQLESSEDIWRHKVLGVPIWYYAREHYSDSTRPVPFKRRRISLIGLFKAAAYLLSSRRKHLAEVHCFVDRKDLVDFYRYRRHMCSGEMLLILNKESGVDTGCEHLTSDLFDVLRFVCRLLGWVFLLRCYRSVVSGFKSDFVSEEHIRASAKRAIGDAIYNVMLTKILPKSETIFYSGGVIPISEKFLGLLNSREIQHGVIHRNHPGYIGVPGIKNTLVLYSGLYRELLQELKYSGCTEVVRFKSAHQVVPPRKLLKVVVYTQPIPELSRALDRLIEMLPGPVYVKPHPRDSYKYSERAIIIQDVHPLEVEFPVLYCSSVVEDFLVHGKEVYLIELAIPGIDLAGYLEAYARGKERLVNVCSADAIAAIIGGATEVRGG